jgi:hypothetical protein
MSREVKVTGLPQSSQFGWHYFHEDRCCLFTLGVQTARTILGRGNRTENEIYPDYLRNATRVAFIEYIETTKQLPKFIQDNMTSLESLYVEHCTMEFLSQVIRRQVPPSSLRHIIAFATGFLEDRRQSDDVKLRIFLQHMVSMRFDFDIAIQLSDERFTEGRRGGMMLFTDGYNQLIYMLGHYFDIIPVSEENYQVYSLNNPDEFLFFIEKDNDGTGRAGLPMHFFRNVKPRFGRNMEIYSMRTFDNLNYMGAKVFNSRINANEMNNGNLGERGLGLEAEYTIVKRFMLEQDMFQFAPHDRIPFWQSEIRNYLGKNISFEDFGVQEGGAKMNPLWKSIRNMFEIAVVTNREDIVSSLLLDLLFGA